MKQSAIKSFVEASCKRIAPAWPLKNFVAVNPFTGFTDTEFSETAKYLSKRGNIRMTMPISFYLEQVESGGITAVDLTNAIKKQNKQISSPDSFIKKAKEIALNSEYAQTDNVTLTGIASIITGNDWNDFMVERISSWAASYFDEYIALWNTSDTNKGLYHSWKSEAEIDRSAELMGLPGFRAAVKDLPNNHLEAISAILAAIKLPEEAIEAYLHALLLKTIGWSSYISGLDFNAALYAGESKRLEEFLAIHLVCDFYFLEAFGNEKVKDTWYKNMHGEELSDAHCEERLETALIFQEAFDFACQRSLISDFKMHKPSHSAHAVDAQMVFCIDVRSEAYRRNLESITPHISTIGFAGFFGFPINYLPLGHSQGKNQCPVLIPSAVHVKERFSNNKQAARRRKTLHQIEKTWKRFKSGAVNSFGFVSPLGLSFLPKLILNSTGITRPVHDPKQDRLKSWFKEERILDLSGITLEQKVQMAAGALTGMGINDNLAPLVLITGHGSSSVNNPHASGLDCGACGGHSGEINALTAVQILNEEAVRKELVTKGINIPSKTLFVACLHNTTTDEIEIINENFLPESHKSAMVAIKESLKEASELNRLERAQRMNLGAQNASEITKNIVGRANDWAQVRPEWGLAGCNAFVIAPRHRTKGLNLKGKSFLQSYDASKDHGNAILESIMTAPMVVTSWINLQYYASSVDNLHFGSGNKTLHNVTGGIGVLEGSTGDLRIGLPLQSVHNGKTLEHLPQRLNVIIEASKEAINGVLLRNESIKQLCDNAWITLLRLDENGQISQKYTKDCRWQEIESLNVTADGRELLTR